MSRSKRYWSNSLLPEPGKPAVCLPRTPCSQSGHYLASIKAPEGQFRSRTPSCLYQGSEILRTSLKGLCDSSRHKKQLRLHRRYATVTRATSMSCIQQSLQSVIAHRLCTARRVKYSNFDDDFVTISIQVLTVSRHRCTMSNRLSRCSYRHERTLGT